MSQRTGTANLPLHGGRVPEWLRQRMARLGRVIVEAIALRYGRDAVLDTLRDLTDAQLVGVARVRCKGL